MIPSDNRPSQPETAHWDPNNPELQSVFVKPRVFPGLLNSLNKRAFDWGPHSHVAYGCQNVIAVVTAHNSRVFQVLEAHRAAVINVKWRSEDYHHGEATPYSMKLVSADSSGWLISWDVVKGRNLAEFHDNRQPVVDMSWLIHQPFGSNHDLLATLHSPYNLILWEADTGNRLWKKSFTSELYSFTFDSFDPNRVAFFSNNCILLVDDFSVSKSPSSNGKKYFITSQTSTSSDSSSPEDKHHSLSDTRAAIKRVTRMLVFNEREETTNKPAGTSTNLNDCLQVEFIKARRDILLLLYPREVLFIDLHVFQTVSYISLDKPVSSLLRCVPCRSRDAVLCLHENGAVSLRVCGVGRSGSVSPQSHDSSDIIYDLRATSESIRVSKFLKPFSLCVNPISELNFSVIFSDGRIYLYSVMSSPRTQTNKPSGSNYCYPTSLNSPGRDRIFPKDCPNIILSDLFSPTMSFETDDGPPVHIGAPPTSAAAVAPLVGSGAPPVPTTDTTAQHPITLRIITSGILPPLVPPPFVIRMCPPLTTRNFPWYQPLLAVSSTSGTGGTAGVLQILNLSKGLLVKQFAVHSNVIRGVQWLDLNSVVTFAYPNPSPSSGLVLNEISLLDITTGVHSSLRGDKGDEPPIVCIRVSHLRQYLAVVFADPKPFEIWDLRSQLLVREMPRRFPTISALEWSQSAGGGKSAAAKRQSGVGDDIIGLEIGDLGSTPQRRASFREHFVCSDYTGMLYHFTVEGNVVRDSNRIPVGNSQITCMSWKADTVVLADTDANIHLWDLKARLSRTFPTSQQRGIARKARFAPGKGNLNIILLYNDGVDVWDTRAVELVSSLRSPKDLVAKLVDVDWASSDKPVLASSDGCLRVFDLGLTTTTSSIDFARCAPSLNPALLPHREAMALKSLIQNQDWRENFSFNFTDLKLDNQEILSVSLRSLDNSLVNFISSSYISISLRCFIAAMLFSDQFEMRLWAVLLFYLKKEKSRVSSANQRAASSEVESSSANQRAASSEVVLGLDSSYDVLCDSSMFRATQIERSALHDAKRSTYEQTKRCVETCLLLGNTERAVQLLLETDPGSDSFYTDCISACLVANVNSSSGLSLSTVKLVATHLIANGRLSEGVQLLCMIGKSLDACKYLMTYNCWNRAVWLAKATLPPEECSEVLRRWIDYLSSAKVNRKDLAVLVWVSQGEFLRAVELLHSLGYGDTAGLVLLACRQFGFLGGTEQTRAQTLCTSVLGNYARHLWSVGLQSAAEYYCKELGDRGEDIIAELTLADDGM